VTTSSVQETTSYESEKINHKDEDQTTESENHTSTVSSKGADLSSGTESLMEWIDRQLREAEMKTKNDETEINAILSQNSSSDVTSERKTETEQINKCDNIASEVGLKTEHIKNNVDNDVVRQHVNDSEEDSIYSVINFTTEKSKSEERNNTDAEKKADLLSRSASHHSKTTITGEMESLNEATSSMSGLDKVTCDENGSASDTEIELLTEDKSEIHTEAAKLLEESESDSDAEHSSSKVTYLAPVDEGIEENESIYENIVLRPTWQKNPSKKKPN